MMNPFAPGGALALKADASGGLPGVTDVGGEKVDVVRALGGDDKKTVVAFLRHMG